ncbi:MAG: HepT-like ribonuclease domain-containing protein [Bacteroidia bacterium]
MKRDDKVYIADILESIKRITGYLGDKSEFEFSNDLLLQDGVIRRFEVIGEAASKISPEFKSAHTSIEWGLMKDMRNKLIHEYFGISTTIPFIRL